MSAESPELGDGREISRDAAIEIAAKTIVGLEAHLPNMFSGKNDKTGQKLFTARGMVEVARDEKAAQRFAGTLYPLVDQLTRTARKYEKSQGMEPGSLISPETQRALAVLAVEAGWEEEGPLMPRFNTVASPSTAPSPSPEARGVKRPAVQPWPEEVVDVPLPGVAA